jgi:hypothetical protein
VAAVRMVLSRACANRRVPQPLCLPRAEGICRITDSRGLYRGSEVHTSGLWRITYMRVLPRATATLRCILQDTRLSPEVDCVD